MLLTVKIISRINSVIRDSFQSRFVKAVKPRRAFSAEQFVKLPITTYSKPFFASTDNSNQSALGKSRFLRTIMQDMSEL